MTDSAIPVVLGAYAWPSNAELILDAHKLGYLRDEDLTLDPTFHRGIWWNLWKPRRLITRCNHVDPTWDFRKTSFPDSMFDAIAYDPPYVSKGGRDTSGIKDMDERYGQVDAPKSPALLQDLIDDGMTEMYRILKPGGRLLVKVQSYISSGRLWKGVHFTVEHGESLGLEQLDQFEMIGDVRPQPPGRVQKHARRNHSTLLIFAKGKNG